MSKENKIVEGRAILHSGSRLSAIWTYTPAHTGRTVTGGEAFKFAFEWANLQTRKELLAHDGCREFDHFVPQTPILTDTALPCLRGRGITNSPPGPEQMGPPLDTKTPGGGRYNQEGECVLYLSDSEDGVRREQTFWNAKGIPYVQRFRLPLARLRIADFTRSPPDHFVTAVFSKAEECNVDGFGSNGYIFSQTVAEIVKSHFDGMMIPGCRGGSSARYSNIVVFRPSDWFNWLEPGTVPYQLTSAS